MYELRVSSGFHRGATLPLDNRAHLIGTGEYSDVMLTDPGIAQHHATLWRTGSGWLLTAADGNIHTADSNESQSAIDLMPGNFVRLGHLWLTIVEQGALWEEPPEPIEARSIEAIAIDSTPDQSPALAIASGDAPAPSTAQSVEEENAATNTATRRRRRSRRSIILVSLAVLATVTAAAAYAMMGKPVTEEETRNAIMQVGKASIAGKPEDKPGIGARPATTQQQLRKEFRKRLADVGLLKRFDLKLDEQTWLMQANLDDEESAQFERVLLGFMREYLVAFPVHAKIASAANMLPFKIHMVTSGANASVMMQDGRRVYVGEEYQGVRLVAIKRNRITFAGTRRIEMNW